jgi:hypothetical protein
MPNWEQNVGVIEVATRQKRFAEWQAVELFGCGDRI